MRKASLVFISIFLIIVTFMLHVGIAFSLTDDDHLPLYVVIPEGKAYDIANQERYNTNFVTIFFLVDHDWVYANQLQNDLITVDQYQYNLDNQGWKTFTPISENIQYHYVVTYMTADYVSGDIRPGSEELDVCWATREELLNLDMNPGVRDFMFKAFEKVNSVS